MAGELAGTVFTDPPYNVAIGGHVSGLGEIQHREFAMASGEMTPEQFTDFLGQVLQHLAASSRDGSLHFICMDYCPCKAELSHGEAPAAPPLKQTKGDD